MSSGENTGGLMSNAGLVRYYEEDGSEITFDPRTVAAGSALIGVFLYLANYMVI